MSTLVSSGLQSPSGVAVDGSGNVYIADWGAMRIKEWSPATQTVATLLSAGPYYPSSVAVDALGNIYFTDRGTQEIKELLRAYVPGGTVNEGAAAGSDALPPVLPTSELLAGVFAPTSDQSWLTIGSVAGGVVQFSFTQNTGAAADGAHQPLGPADHGEPGSRPGHRGAGGGPRGGERLGDRHLRRELDGRRQRLLAPFDRQRQRRRAGDLHLRRQHRRHADGNADHRGGHAHRDPGRQPPMWRPAPW